MKYLIQKTYSIAQKITLLLLISLASFACSDTKKRREIKLAHSLDVSHSVHKAMEFMAQSVKEKSNGQMVIDIYPNATLGSERETLELLQIGSLGMTKVSAAVMESFAPNYKAYSLPYIFESKAHHFAVLDGEIGKNMLKEGEKFWLRGLCYYDAGSRSFYTIKKPINHPDDLKGMKIRVQASATAISMVKSFGGSATPISWGELYTSLQQGVVDGAENNSPSFFLSRHYEVCKYYSLNEHAMVPDILLISTIIWDSLDPQEQQWLKEAAEESAVVQRKLWAISEKENLEALKKAGVIVNIPDKAPFAAMVEPMYDTYKAEPEVYEIIQKIQQAAGAQ